MRICFDMDGTLNLFYRVLNWLWYLEHEDAYPYRVAEPAFNFSLLARYLNKLQKMGFKLVIISWLSKSGSEQYNEAVIAEKLLWLKRHLPSVHWDEIIIVPYGDCKNNYCRSATDVLFDDELRNRENWTGRAYPETAIFEVLKELMGR